MSILSADYRRDTVVILEFYLQQAHRIDGRIRFISALLDTVRDNIQYELIDHSDPDTAYVIGELWAYIIELDTLHGERVIVGELLDLVITKLCDNYVYQ